MTVDYRERVRAWLAAAPRPAGLHDYGPTPASDDVAPGRVWQRQLAEGGYACLHWPAEHGGPAATPLQQAVFAEEAARADVPRQLGIVGPDLVGPVLMRFGTTEQQACLLEPIRTGEALWCQLFSEPGAGSDLASVRTTARRDPDAWVVNGQKVWTSAGKDADLGLLLARTGPGRSGLSAFVVDMSLPGITVRPLVQLDGESKFNEVFLEDVRLPLDAIVGAEGDGWLVAKTTLGRERVSLGAGCVALFAALEQLAQTVHKDGLFDQHARHRLADLWMRVWLLRATWFRALEEGDDLSSPAFSVLKLMSSTAQRDLGELGLELLGSAVTTGDAESLFRRRLLVGPAQTLLGGTSEIQRTILAERVLGLPREPSR